MYCTRQQVINEFKQLQIKETGTLITHALIDEWIEQESEFIDSYISARYITPVSSLDSPKSLKVLARIAIFRVTERVKNKLEITSNATQLNSAEKFTQNYVRTPNDDLNAIRKGDMNLVDAKLKSSDLGVGSFSTKNKGNCAFFDVTKQQW